MCCKCSSFNGIEKYPKLRFQGFTIPWTEIEIGKAFQVTRGYVLPATVVRQDASEEYIYPVYSSQTKDNGLMGYYNDYLYENAITWTTDGANAGTVHYRSGKFYCTNVCGVLLSDEGNANRCVAEILGSVSKKYVSYVGNPKLMNNVMSEIKIYVPTIAEQKKIDAFISVIDHRIEKQQELIEYLKKYKRGLNIRLLSGISMSYSKRLGDVCSIIGGGTPDTTTAKFWDGGINWFTPSEIGKTKYVVSSLRSISYDGMLKSSAKLLPQNTVLLTTRATLGEMSILQSEATTNQGFQSLIPSEEILAEYVYYLQVIIKPWCEKYASGNTFREISKSALSNCLIPVPDISTQNKLVRVLSGIDQHIEHEKDILDKLRDQKKALLQQLFI